MPADPPVPEDAAGRAGPPAVLATVATSVEARLRALLDAESRRWRAVDADLGPLVDALTGMVGAGGKRLRPAFCRLAHEAVGGDGASRAVVDAGAAIELLHATALVHDDVIDGSTRRRGRDAVHVAFGARHEAEAWGGETRRFGEGAAILVGDLAFALAGSLLADAGPAAQRVFWSMCVEVNAGQWLDVVNTVRGGADVETARRICRYKSATYTVERPLHLGAALHGPEALEDHGDALSRYGLALGEAFQLRDDLLGAFGDPASTGKPVGDDLREGKPTVLLALARSRARGDDARVLTLVGRPALDDDGVAAVQDVLVRCGARDAVEADIDRLLGDALGALDGAGLAPGPVDELVSLARFVARRDR